VTVEIVRRRDEVTGNGGPHGEPFVIEESLGYLVNYVAKTFARALGDRLAPHGVTTSQWAVLMFLWAEEGLSQTELSRRVAIDDATMVRTLDRMERDGLVRRERDTRDRRRINVVLSERGRALRDRLVPCAVAVNAAATRSLTAAERRQLLDLLRRMIAALEAEPSPDEARR
jgi:DNA-binding MarR family transcriptional regulator